MTWEMHGTERKMGEKANEQCFADCEEFLNDMGKNEGN